MSDVQTPAPTPVAATPAPAQKLTAIQIIEQEIANFIKQRESAVANVHALEGAIQAGQHLLAKLKAAAVTAETEVKKLVGEAEAEISKGIAIVKEKI